jgi:hypothetical protein
MRYNNYITAIDLILILLIYLPLIFIVASNFSNRMKPELKGYFMKGLALKLLCGLGFGWLYVYYYGGGDTQMYFRGASRIYNAIPEMGLSAFLNPDILPYGSASTIFTQKFAGAVNLLSLNSFWTCTLLFAALSFIGLWLIFLSFYRLFPRLHKHLAIATLFIPGVVFWSSGIMKDSICMLFIGVIVYYIQNIFLFRRKILISAVLITAGFYVIVILKAYIALAMLLSIALYALLALKAGIKNPTTKMLVMPIAAVMIIGGAVLAMNQIGASLQRYSLENLAETAQIYQTYHYRTSVAGRGGSSTRTGSGYTLGEINYSNPLSIASKFPLAVSTTYFRPFVWEVRNPVMLLSALESLIIMLFTLKVIRRAGIFNFFKQVVSQKEVLFCFTFAIIFGFAVGFTSYNFGSLVRYKAPCVPFYLIALVLVNASIPVKKEKVIKRSMPAKPFAAPYTIHQQPS